MKIKLSNLAQFKGGSAFPQDQQGRSAGAFPFMKVSDLSLDTGAWKTTRANNWLTYEQAKDLKPTIVPPSSTIFAKIGEGLKNERCRITTRPTAIDNNMMAAIPTEFVNAKYLYFMLKTIGLSTYAVGSALPYIKQGTLNNIELEVPSLDEQYAIAEVLGALDDKIAANDQVSRTVESLGSAKFSHLGLDTEPHDAVLLLEDIFDLNPRRKIVSATPTVIDMQALPTATPLVTQWASGLPKGGTRFKNGDTLIARITPCLENRKTSFVDFLKDGEVGIGSTEFIVLRSKHNLPLGLSYFMAISPRFRDYAIQNLVGTSGRQRVSSMDLARYNLSSINHSYLHAFGNWADENLKVLGSLRDENNILATTRDTLLPQLMSGKLKVNQAEEIVASRV